MTQDDLLYRFRLRTFALAGELGNVRAACRAMGIHPSTSYRWKRQLDRYGPDILRPRERQVPRMANATSPLVEQRVVAFALGHPGFGPARIAAEVARPNWGGIRPQTNGCVERVQQTILEECWKPAFARCLIPKQTGLRLDLERHLRYDNTERAHTGRWTHGRTPDQVLGKAKLWHKKR